MASVNKVILIGNLGKDPEVRYTSSGAAICNLRMATTRSWKDKQSGERQEETEWHSVVIYDRSAEAAGEYLVKGSKVYVEGRLKTRKWQDKDGVDKWTTEIVADTVQFLDGKNGGGEREGDDPQRDNRGRPQQRSQGQREGGQQQRPPQRSQGKPQRQQNSFDDMDDDIPF